MVVTVLLHLLQGLAAGLMLSISLIDLLPEAAEEIGFIPANLCFYAGVLFFAAIVALIPEPDVSYAGEQKQSLRAGTRSTGKEGSSNEQGVLASAPPAPKTPVPGSPQQQPPGQLAGADATTARAHMRRRSNTAAASVSPAEARLDRSCGGYLPPAVLPAQQQQQQLPSPHSLASSCGLSTDLQVLVNEEGGSGGSSKEEERKHRQQLLMSGLITAVGIGEIIASSALTSSSKLWCTGL
jgi:hypothetical protein